MSHIANQQREIYKIAVGLYAAAPGTSYFAELNGGFEAGMSVSDLYQVLANAPSFQLQDPAFGSQSTNAQFSTAFLQRLLGTDVPPAGQSFAFSFVFDRLQAGVSRGEVMHIAIDALDAVPSTDPDFGAAAERFDNRILVARSFTELLGNASLDIQFLQSTIASVTNEMASVNAAVAKWSGGFIFDLTPGQDVLGGSFTGNPGNDVFNAPLSDDGQQTLNTGDTLAGGGGRDTLKATIADENVLPILASIETVDVRFEGFLTLDLSSAPGVEQVIVEASSTTGTVLGLGGVGDLVVRDQQQHVVFDGLTVPELSLTLQRFGAPGAFDDVVLGTAHPITVDHLDLTLVDANAQLKIGNVGPPPTVTIDASGVNTLRLASPTTGVNTLAIIGSGSVDLTGTPLTDLTSLAGQSATGAIAATVDASAINIVTGAGADTVTYTEPISGNARIDLGAGDDLLVLNGLSAPGAQIAGGSGNDTLKATSGDWIDTAARGVYSGFETLEIGGGAGTYVMSRLPGVHNITSTDSLPNGVVTVSDAPAGTSLSFINHGEYLTQFNKTNVVLRDATGNDDTLRVAFESPSFATSFVDLVLPGIEVLDLVANAVARPPSSSSVVASLTVAGSELRTLTLSGNARLLVSGSFENPVAITNVDASRSSGGIQFFGLSNTAPVLFVGSEVNDLFIAPRNNDTGHGDTIDAGGGGDDISLAEFGMGDRLIYEAGDSLLTPGPDRAYDGIGNFNAPRFFNVHSPDVIDLTKFGFTATETSALTDKGALDASAVDGSTLFQPAWFVSSGETHAVAIGNRMEPGPVIPDSGGRRLPDRLITYVYVDVNHDGDFEAATDLFIQVGALLPVTLDNFVF